MDTVLSLTASAIILNPAAYGLLINTEKVHKGGKLYHVPVASITNTVLFGAAFGIALAHELMSGSSSFRVKWQGKARTYADANPTAAFGEILTHCIEGILLGVKTARGGVREVIREVIKTVIEYRIIVGGTAYNYPLATESQAEIVAAMVEAGFTVDAARDAVEFLTTAGEA